MTHIPDSTTMGQQEIAADIRHNIVQGDYEPGIRLPRHRDLVELYASTPSTVQGAIQILIDQGFVKSVPRQGRFVAEHPPHTHRIGLVFPGHPEGIHSYRWTRYFAAVWAAAEKLNSKKSWQLVPYFDIEPTENGDLTEAYGDLMKDVRSHRVAGLVFTYAANRLKQTDLFTEHHVPAVSLAHMPDGWGPRVTLDRDALLDRIVAHLVGRNRRRLAWMTIMQHDPDYLRPMLNELNNRYGFYSPASWIQPLDPFHTRWVRHSIQAIFDAPMGERPDGLIILDDHLIAPVTNALERMSLDVPDDLNIAGYWNFPLRYDGTMPVKRVGMDTIRQLTTALDSLAQDKGEKLIPPTSAAEFRKQHGEEAQVQYQTKSPRENLVQV